jgi:hypothetical protein
MTILQTLKDLLVYLDGKKTYINSAVLLIVPYLITTGIINGDLGTLICGIIGLLTGSGKYVADKAAEKGTSDFGLALLKKRG